MECSMDIQKKHHPTIPPQFCSSSEIAKFAKQAVPSWWSHPERKNYHLRTQIWVQKHTLDLAQGSGTVECGEELRPHMDFPQKSFHWEVSLQQGVKSGESTVSLQAYPMWVPPRY